MKRYLWPLALLLLSGCTWDNLGDEASGYPTEIAAIVVNRCATSGCHTTQSAEAAAGLNLETWNSLYLGSRGGSAVVPYSPEQSYFLYAVNQDTSNGDPALVPTMPIGGAALTDAEYALVKQWIADGARNAKGELRFPDSATRRKWYLSNQGCDLVAVIDAESRQIMRYVKVGASASTEYPHSIKVSNDGQYWYVIYLFSNQYIEKYSTLTDQKVGQIHIGAGSWNTFSISADGKFGIAVSYYLDSYQDSLLSAAIVDLEHDVMTAPIRVGKQVHGSAAHPNRSRFYLTLQTESGLFWVDYDAAGHITDFDFVDLVRGVPNHINPSTHLQPHEVLFTPDGSHYFVTCQGAAEVRAYRSADDHLEAVIHVGADPVEMALSPETGHLFVTCMEDHLTFASDPHKHGSVAIIDYHTHTLVKSVYTGYQPHGVVVDEVAGLAVVSNRNIDVNGPAPHHVSDCGGRNGYATAIDLHTLELIPRFKAELASDPYAVAIKP